MTDSARQLTGIRHNLSNEEYRAQPGLSATFLKGCLRSVKHALTPRKPTKATDTGLRLHEFILERDKFLSTYAPGIDLTAYPDAIGTMEELRAAIDQLNESRKTRLAKSGSRTTLIEQLYADDPHHFDGVQDVDKLSVADLKKRIDFVNSQPDRGLISSRGSAIELTSRLIEYGYTGQITHQLIAEHNARHAGRTILPLDEYNRYNAMYESLLHHLRIGANRGDSLMAWLLYAFTTPGVLQTEVSVIGKDRRGNPSKCRLDARFLATDKWIGVELKTTRDADTDAFTKQCASKHYDLQHEHYIETCESSSEPLAQMPFIAIEPEAPYGINIFRPDEEFRLTGQKKLAYAKRKYSEYLARGKDNAVYSPTVKQLTSPLWNTCGPWENEEL